MFGADSIKESSHKQVPHTICILCKGIHNPLWLLVCLHPHPTKMVVICELNMLHMRPELYFLQLVWCSASPLSYSLQCRHLHPQFYGCYNCNDWDIWHVGKPLLPSCRVIEACELHGVFKQHALPTILEWQHVSFEKLCLAMTTHIKDHLFKSSGQLRCHIRLELDQCVPWVPVVTGHADWLEMSQSWYDGGKVCHHWCACHCVLIRATKVNIADKSCKEFAALFGSDCPFDHPYKLDENLLRYCVKCDVAKQGPLGNIAICAAHSGKSDQINPTCVFGDLSHNVQR